MTDDTLKKIARSGGCRLCLAPDSECVPIFATAAADKEPLSNKILSCVSIKVSLNSFKSVLLFRNGFGTFKMWNIHALFSLIRYCVAIEVEWLCKVKILKKHTHTHILNGV